jgi:ribonuclease D
LEAYNKSNYAQMTCLLQITTNKGREYVIDPLAPGVWDLVGELAPLFADPKVVKIGHSIGGLDVRCLHRDFGIFVVNAFDTYEAAKCLKLPGVGLAKVCATYGLPDCKMYQSLKDQYQNCDWRQRPLTGPMIQYGRYDIRYLIELRTLMIRDLAKQELWDNDHVSKEAEARQVATSLAAILRKFDEEDEACDSDVDSKNSDDEGYSTPVSTFDEEFQDSYELESEAVNGILERKAQFNAMELRMNSALMQVISLSQNRCLDLWTSRPEPHLKNSEFLLILKRSKSGEIECTSSQIQLYDKLVRWREYVATQEECLPGFICPLDLFAHISYKRPTTEAALRKLSYILPDLLEERDNIYVYELLQLVIESRKVDELEAEEVSDIPCYEAYLEQEKKRERSLSTAASSNLWRSTVTYSAICVAAIAITILAVRRRR